MSLPIRLLITGGKNTHEAAFDLVLDVLLRNNELTDTQ